MDVRKLCCLCAVRFFRSRFFMLFLSQKKNAYTQTTSRNPYKLLAKRVSPVIMPISMTRKISKMMPRFCAIRPRGKNK